MSHLRTKCSPICAADSTNCCMARLLSQQDDFKHQESMLEVLIRKAGHECIFLPKFHCELNPIEMVCHPLYCWLDYSLKTIFFQFRFHQYWGWAKYRYRKVPKEGFAQAKELTMKWLDACPDEVIRRFINRSFRFVSAYWRGLKGKVALWAVRHQKSHRQVSAQAMMLIEAVLN